MEARRTSWPGAAALLAAVGLIAACSGSGSVPTSETTAATGASTTSGAGPVFSYTIDGSLGGGESGVETIGAGEVASHFVAGRLVVVFEEESVLDGIVARYGGRVVRRYSTADYGLAGPTVAVVEVDGARADLAALPAAMDSLGAVGSVRFGSEEGARLAAIAAAERAAGNRVSLDWVVEPTAIPFSTVEEEAQESAGWVRDAYQLSYYRSDAVQGIGVAEAWSLMYYAGVLDRRVPLAVLDWGFTVDEDFADPLTHAMDPAQWAFGAPDDEGYYHGYLTAATAMALPDNGYGVAGVAGVVARPILIQMDDRGLSGYAQALLQAYSMGARIVSMSFIAPILADALPLADALDEVTARLADAGVLMFASSGNGGGNVDEVVAQGGVVYGTRPCQAPGVVCIGGLGVDSVERHESSTYGDPGGSVALYAPYCVHGFPPGGTGSVFSLCGTSFSAPFAAGVAALIWAADPGLTADEVRELMESTARGGRWPRVNALDAVAAALGPFTGVEFIEPVEGSDHQLGTAVTLAATVVIPTDPDTTSTPVRVRFTSDRDGLLDDHTWTVPMSSGSPLTRQRVSTVAASLSEGTHRITVTAAYQGIEASDTLTLTVGNSPPSELRILQPENGSESCAGAPVRFRGDAFDINEQLGLPESAFRWRSDRDGLLGTGRNLTAAGLSVGTHRITLRVVDAGGLASTARITIEVLAASDPACRDLPPDVAITSPSARESFYVGDPGVESGSDAYGVYVVITVRVAVADDHDAAGDLTVDIYVTPEWPDTWVGPGPEQEVRLHLPAQACSQKKEVRVVVFDSAGNRSEDSIEIFVNQFC